MIVRRNCLSSLLRQGQSLQRCLPLSTDKTPRRCVSSLTPWNQLPTTRGMPSSMSHIVTRGSSRTFSTPATDDLLQSHHTHHLPITTFSEDETMIQHAVRTWSREVLLPRVRKMDQQGHYDSDILEDLFTQGYLSLEIPPDYGGSGLAFTAACLTVEEISRVDPSVAILVDIHNTLAINAVRTWGSSQLQEEWLPRLATDTIASFCLSEAGSGSDAFAMKMTATATPGGYVLQGTKLWISNAQEAGVLLVFANANPSAGYKGITAFMVDATTPGITIGPPEAKLGLKASSTCPIHFDQVHVDASRVLGHVGQGYKYCIEILNEGRIGIAAQQVGIAKGCLDIVLPYVQERMQFGQPIGQFQGMQHQIARVATEIHAAECLTYNACRVQETTKRQHHPSSTASTSYLAQCASMAKLYSSQVAEQTASKTIEWLGGIGFTQDLLAEKFYRDCKVGSIYEGTSNIQLQTIAKLLLSSQQPQQQQPSKEMK
jgi:short-chain 2-methylacyl-CoA dehydrogenase